MNEKPFVEFVNSDGSRVPLRDGQILGEFSISALGLTVEEIARVGTRLSAYLSPIAKSPKSL